MIDEEAHKKLETTASDVQERKATPLPKGKVLQWA